jgi:hypothetical protein
MERRRLHSTSSLDLALGLQEIRSAGSHPCRELPVLAVRDRCTRAPGQGLHIAPSRRSYPSEAVVLRGTPSCRNVILTGRPEPSTKQMISIFSDAVRLTRRPPRHGGGRLILRMRLRSVISRAWPIIAAARFVGLPSGSPFAAHSSLCPDSGPRVLHYRVFPAQIHEHLQRMGLIIPTLNFSRGIGRLHLSQLDPESWMSPLVVCPPPIPFSRYSRLLSRSIAATI